jgi:hypothetical protein
MVLVSQGMTADSISHHARWLRCIFQLALDIDHEISLECLKAITEAVQVTGVSVVLSYE